MDFYTGIKIDKVSFNIHHTDHIMVLGSCFADNVGRRLLDGKFDCVVNPFGTLYNPLSILSAVEMMAQGKTFVSSDLFYSQGLWHSWTHHGAFSSPSAEDSLALMNTSMDRARRKLADLDVLILTYGTAWVYRLSDASAHVVANCHKQSERMFIRQMEDVEALEKAMCRTVEAVRAVSPSTKVIFTVSPIRHVRDGMHANQLSKAALLLAVDKTIKRCPDTAYFPSYEIMIDELRDYRFYDDDMVHPSNKAVEYIWERFSDTYFNRDTKDLMREWGKIALGIAHRPLHGNTDDYRRFIETLRDKIVKIKNKHPYLDVEKELELCNTRLEI